MNGTIRHVIRLEGGYVNDPQDKGGETKYGISKRSYPDIDIENLTVEQAEEIYYHDYWIPSRADELEPGIREIYFDMVVNMGQRNAVKVLQEACNSVGENLLIDGRIGSKTIQSSRKVKPQRLRAYRVLRYAKIVINNPTQRKFYYGWFRRAMKV